MDPELSQLLEAASLRAAMEFSPDYQGGIYEELEDQSIDPTGLAKIFATAEGNRFREFTGNLEFSSIQERGLSILTRVFKYGNLIPRQKWDQLIAWLGARLLNLVAAAGANYRAEKDMMHTSLLNKAVRGDTIKSLYHDSIYLGNIPMPGSGIGAPTVINTNLLDHSGTTLNADRLRDIYHAVRAHVRKYRYPNGLPYFGPESTVQNLRLMYLPTQKMDKLVMDTFDTGDLTASQTVARIRNVMLKPNNLWLMDEFEKLNGSDGTSILLFYWPVPKESRLRFFQWVRRDKELTIETNLPQDRAEADSMFQTDSVISTEKYKWAPRFEGESGPGGPLQVCAVKVKGVA